jgi:ABC-type phosphate transport system permease subunit
MKEAAALMSFLRHDPVGQRLGVGVIVMAWFALAWTSLAVAIAVPILLVVAEVVRRRRDEEPIVDDLEDLY